MKTIFARKWMIFFILLILAYPSYYAYGKLKPASPTQYSLSKVEKGTLIVSIAGTGQVSAATQIDIKPKVSGNIVSISIKEGQAIMQLDTKDYNNSLKQASLNVEIAKANLNLKLAGLTPEDKKIADQSLKSSQLSYDNSITGTVNTKGSSALSLANKYEDAKNSVYSTIVSLRSNLYFADTIIGVDSNAINSTFKDYLGAANPQSLLDAENSYKVSKSALLLLEQHYDAQKTSTDQKEIDLLIDETIQNSQNIKDLMHYTYVLLTYTITGASLSQTTLDSYKSSASSKESSMVSTLSTMQGIKQDIATAKFNMNSTDLQISETTDSAKISLENSKKSLNTAKDDLKQIKIDNAKKIDTAEADVKSKKISLESAEASYDLKVAPPRDIDVANNKLQVTQAEESYQQALQNMKDATIYAPIDGVIAKINSNVGDSVSNSTAVATILLMQQF